MLERIIQLYIRDKSVLLICTINPYKPRPDLVTIVLALACVAGAGFVSANWRNFKNTRAQERRKLKG